MAFETCKIYSLFAHYITDDLTFHTSRHCHRGFVLAQRSYKSNNELKYDKEKNGISAIQLSE